MYTSMYDRRTYVRTCRSVSVHIRVSQTYIRMYIQVGQFTYMLVCVLYPFFADVGQVSGTAAEKPVGPEQTDQETDTNEIRILIYTFFCHLPSQV